MSVRRGTRRPGRPLLGTERLGERLTVLISRSMLSKIETRSGGHVSEFVRRVLARVLSVRVGKGGRVGRKGRRVRRYRG